MFFFTAYEKLRKEHKLGKMPGAYFIPYKDIHEENVYNYDSVTFQTLQFYSLAQIAREDIANRWKLIDKLC